jgi:hypothetical protein
MPFFQTKSIKTKTGPYGIKGIRAVMVKGGTNGRGGENTYNQRQSNKADITKHVNIQNK